MYFYACLASNLNNLEETSQKKQQKKKKIKAKRLRKMILSLLQQNPKMKVFPNAKLLSVQ